MPHYLAHSAIFLVHFVPSRVCMCAACTRCIARLDSCSSSDSQHTFPSRCLCQQVVALAETLGWEARPFADLCTMLVHHIQKEPESCAHMCRLASLLQPEEPVGSSGHWVVYLSSQWQISRQNATCSLYKGEQHLVLVFASLSPLVTCRAEPLANGRAVHCSRCRRCTRTGHESAHECTHSLPPYNRYGTWPLGKDQGDSSQHSAADKAS